MISRVAIPATIGDVIMVMARKAGSSRRRNCARAAMKPTRIAAATAFDELAR